MFNLNSLIDIDMNELQFFGMIEILAVFAYLFFFLLTDLNNLCARYSSESATSHTKFQLPSLYCRQNMRSTLCKYRHF
jgi:hypothetical protein